MLWTVCAVVLVLWVLGFGLCVAGGLIHLLLGVPLMILVFKAVSERPRVAVKVIDAGLLKLHR